MLGPFWPYTCKLFILWHMRRSRQQARLVGCRCPTARSLARLLGAAAALHHTAADTAAATAAYEPGEPTGNGRGLVGAATTPRHGESPYKGRSAYGFFDARENCTQSSLWDREVDASSYELGCEEIEVSVARVKRKCCWLHSSTISILAGC